MHVNSSIHKIYAKISRLSEIIPEIEVACRVNVISIR